MGAKDRAVSKCHRSWTKVNCVLEAIEGIDIIALGAAGERFGKYHNEGNSCYWRMISSVPSAAWAVSSRIIIWVEKQYVEKSILSKIKSGNFSCILFLYSIP